MKFPDRRRVVITGLGVLAPNGIGIDNFWRTLVSAESGIGPITRFDASQLKTQIAGEVKNFEVYDYIDPAYKTKRKARHTQFALAGTVLALKDASIDLKKNPLDHSLFILMGLGSSCLEMVEQDAAVVHQKGPRYASPNVVHESVPSSIAGAISEYLGVNAQCVTFSTGCVAGLDAVADGAERIRRGQCDIAIAGSAESQISLLPMANFDNGGMASRRNSEPQKASRPFDRTRDSGVLSEGCGILVLESLEHALSRGAEPYLEIIGYGSHNDPEVQSPGSGFERSMKDALASASLLPIDIDYISAWGPGHPLIDKVETDMIKRVFGEHAYSLAVSSIKGVMGNPISAAGPLMLVSCCLMFRHDLIPPTANYQEPDPECDLDYVPNHARPSKVKYALLNAHGVGGANGSMILKRFEL